MQARQAILVVGVGRSGTSVLTRVLNLLGAALPEAVIGPGLGNLRGHWEPARLVALNDEMLGVLGLDWWDTSPIRPDWFASDEAAGFIERTAALIAGEYGDARLIVIKDPRLCRLAPICLAALRRLGIAPLAVLPLRHPSEVVGSISGRDGTDAATCELIWIRHSIEAEAATREIPRVWTSYDGLLADWKTTQAKIASGLGVTWPCPTAAVAEALEPALRNYAVGRNASPAAVGRLATMLWEAVRHGDEAVLRPVFDMAGMIIGELDRLNG